MNLKRMTVFVACVCMALFATTAFGDVSGSSGIVGSWSSTGTYSSTITLADPGGDTLITDVTVGVTIDHTWSSDISMSLTDGTTTVLFNAGQGSSDDYASNASYAGSTGGVVAGPPQGPYAWNDFGIPLNVPAANPIVAVVGPFSTNASLNAGPWATSDATWTLTVSDTTNLDGGQISGWTLALTTVPEPTSFALLGLAGVMAVVLRRKR